jgi:hypothetical protein
VRGARHATERAEAGRHVRGDGGTQLVGSDAPTDRLYAWDSGTNAATTYKAGKIEVKPFEPTSVNRSPIFANDGKPVPVVGTVKIRRIG